MSSSSKIDLERDFASGVYLLRPRAPYPPPPAHGIRVYSISVHTWKGGRGGRDEPERRFEGPTVHKSGSKIPT